MFNQAIALNIFVMLNLQIGENLKNLYQNKTMFKKLVSNLPFSPALIGQIGFYANRLRQEEVARRTGLVMLALAVAVQSLTLLSPPTPANASSSSDMIRGGVSSVASIINAYDQNSGGFRDILSYAGITKDDLGSLKEASINSRENVSTDDMWLSWGRSLKFSEEQGEKTHNINGYSVYSRPLTRLDSTAWTTKNGTTYQVYRGKSSQSGDFAIIKNSGNLLTRASASLPSTLGTQQPDSSQKISIIRSKSSSNLTQGVQDATTVKAMAGDRIQYSLSVENKGSATIKVALSDKLDDILEYTSLQDTGGGNYSKNAQTITWPDITLGPGDKQSRTFVVALPASIPSTARGASDPTSYDCIMNNTYGNNNQITVDCPGPKVVEQTVNALPKTGLRENIVFSSLALALVVFLWARSRQLSTEIRLVRREFSNNTLI